MVEHLKDLKLSVFVALVLEHLFDGNCLASLGNGRLEDHSEGPIADNLLSVVSEALL